jgi:uncharacterized protein
MEFRDDPVNNRFVAVQDGQVRGELVYEVIRDGRLRLDHTEVDDALEGQGVGSQLVKFALDELRANDHKIVPDCPFVAGYLDRHPDYRDLVDEELTAQQRAR